MKKIKTALSKIKQLGLTGFVIFLFEEKYKIKLPLSPKLRWNYSKNSELDFWDSFFKTKGLQWTDSFHQGFDPSYPLQEEVVSLLSLDKSQVNILDVGAGPVTYLGKVYKNIKINITAVDPLADAYDKILKKYNISPIIRTKKIAAERLSRMFAKDSFDLVFARNCIDHSYSPERAILEMLNVVKKGCYVLMIHRPNEGITENYTGLHKWNFISESGSFIISSERNSLNFSQKYKNVCKITCEVETRKDGDWLKTIIQKL